LSINPLKLMKSAAAGVAAAAGGTGGTVPPPPAMPSPRASLRPSSSQRPPENPPPRPLFCSAHGTSEQRAKSAPRDRVCEHCQLLLQTNYDQFTLCPYCSAAGHLCTICGSQAAGDSQLAGPQGHHSRQPTPPACCAPAYDVEFRVPGAPSSPEAVVSQERYNGRVPPNLNTIQAAAVAAMVGEEVQEVLPPPAATDAVLRAASSWLSQRWGTVSSSLDTAFSRAAAAAPPRAAGGAAAGGAAVPPVEIAYYAEASSGIAGATHARHWNAVQQGARHNVGEVESIAHAGNASINASQVGPTPRTRQIYQGTGFVPDPPHADIAVTPTPARVRPFRQKDESDWFSVINSWTSCDSQRAAPFNANMQNQCTYDEACPGNHSGEPGFGVSTESVPSVFGTVTNGLVASAASCSGTALDSFQKVGKNKSVLHPRLDSALLRDTALHI